MKRRLPPGVAESNGRYYRVQYLGMINGKRRQKWHPLTRVSEGMAALYNALSTLEQTPDIRQDDIRTAIKEWLKIALPGLSASEQKDVTRMADIIRHSFDDFRVGEVQARHCLTFLNQWVLDGKLRTAQRYRAVIGKFFRWAIVQGYRQDNPVDPIRLKTPVSRDRYITDDEFAAIRAKLLGTDNHMAASGEMMQIFVDLLYLTGQRGTEIRLLRWSQVDEETGVIHFKPTKTAKSSGAKVEITITPAIAEVLARAKALVKAKARISPYVIHNLEGSPYTAHGVGTAWERARKRTDIENATLKDLRAKHATDARIAGYSEAEIQDALAHEDSGTTRIYIKQRMARVSKVELSLPKDVKKAK